jgi:hypothetical protein
MEQLRTLLAWLKKYHFWVLSVVVVVVALVCWYTSSGALGKQFKEHQGAIQSKFSAAQQVASETFHPTAKISDKQVEENKKLAEAVAAIWQKLYERQRANALKWPSELVQDFRDTVEKLKFGDDIDNLLRNHYQNYINRHFPKLPASIQARVVEENSTDTRSAFNERDFAMRGRSGMTVEPLDEGYVCEWPTQQSVRAELEFMSTPSPLKIWVTQENLWAYQTLLDVIAATNQARGADRPSNAAVQIVELLEVGQTAAKESRTSGRIELDPAVLAPPVVAEGGDARGPVVEDTGRDQRGGEGGLTLEQERVLLLSGRYVDEQGKPIAFAGDATTYGTAFGTQYKRLPVRMVVRMDIRSLSFLLTQCANQPLQIEVQEVRLNPQAGVGGGRDSRNDMPAFDSGQGQRFGSSTVETFPLYPNIMRVVIQGVIYIFNEPNPATLLPGEAAAGTL